MLLAGASAVTLLIAAGPADAGQLRDAVANRTATGGANSAVASTATLAAAAAQQAANATSRVNTDLATAAKSLRSALAAQAAAAAAGSSNTTVTDGRSAGGLIVDPRVGTSTGTAANLWVNISQPAETTSTSNGVTSYTETLTQTSQRAIATWQQFNVGKNTTVYFNQSAGNTSAGNSWTVLNRIDATGSPSQILGSIKAEGTVLVINPNGIVFGAGSQVNVHTLIAAAMDINSVNSGTNYGVFNSGNGDYLQVSTTASGGLILAPNNESSGNSQFLSNGLYANSGMGVGNWSSDGLSATYSAAIFSTGTSTGSFGGSGGSGGYSVGSNAGVVVEKGAVISTTGNVSGFDNGGYVALLGPSVTNLGSIGTSAGQIILAASNQVFLAYETKDSTSKAVSPTSLTVATSAKNSSGGVISLVWGPSAVAGGAVTINDTGAVLSSARGNITLAGDTVEQLGVAEASTSITRTGSIIINATGTVTFGPGSVTAIVADENGESIPESAISSANYTPTIAITATNMEMQGGSLIVAPSATMTVTSSPVAMRTTTTPTGRVLLDTGSVIDLGGMEATAAVSDYLYTFKVTANDIADTPLAKSLIGQTVTIDLRLSNTRADGESWVGSPLFAATGAGYLGDVAYSLDQLLSTGGSLKIGGNGAFADVLTAAGSTINLSGGAILYTGGRVTTPNLVTADGRIVNIGSADPFVSYAGLAGSITVAHDRWKVSEIYTNPLTALSSYVDAGYTDGISAGSLAVSAINPVLQGYIAGDTVTGTRQHDLSLTSASAGPTAPDDLPAGASLAIAFTSSRDVVVLDSAVSDVLGPDFTLASTLTLPTDAAGLPVITYSTDLLSAENLGAISIKGANDLSMAKGASLTVRAGGSIAFDNVSTIDGTLTAHAGRISLGGLVPTNPPTAPAFPAVTIGPDAVLDVSGLWINDSGLDNSTLTGNAYINGGSVTVTTNKVSIGVGTPISDNSTGISTQTAVDKTQSIMLAAGSLIDLSSGGYVTTAGNLKTGSDGLPVGNGGNLTLQTYAGGAWRSNTYSGDANYPLAPAAANAATVTMNGTIYAAGLNKGGIFTLQAPVITIDGNAASVATDAATGAVTLPVSFFASGFSAFSLTSTYGDVTVVAGTTLTLKQQTYQIASGATLPATGTEIRDFASLGYALDGERQPVNLTLTQQAFGGFSYATDPDHPAGIVIGNGASIIADPQAAIILSAAGSITVLGSIITPAGTITLTNDDSSLSSGAANYLAAQDIWIGANALLDVSGVSVPNPLITAYSTGSVLDAGSISLTGGTIVALKGSVFDLAGASATVQEPGAAAGLATTGYVSHPIWSNGGTLTLGGSSVYFAGAITAVGGAAEASGGTLTINGGNSIVNIVITQSGDVSAAFTGKNAPATAAQLSSLMSGLALTTGEAFITADTIDTSHSGLDSLSLTGNTIAFSGSVTLKVPGALYLNGNIALMPAGITPSSGLAASGGNTIGAPTVALDAGYIRWLSGDEAVPTAGDGTLTLNAAAQIDLAGVVSVSNADVVNLTVSGGDIRFLPTTDPDIFSYLSSASSYTLAYAGGSVSVNGALLVPGDLTLSAREVYPATGTSFLLASLGLGGTIAVESNGQTPYVPSSAGGAVVVDAASIVQAGAIEVPLGSIILGLTGTQSIGSATTVATNSVTLTAGSLTVTTASGIDIPYGTTTNGENWVSSPPSKLIVLSGASVTTQNGAIVDESGGGDIYATEFVAGTGGTRNLLATNTSSDYHGTNQTVYALVPANEAKVAAYDPTFASAYDTTSVAAGTAVTLAGGNGIAAGTYTLLPAMYATMPGAYRVVVVSTNIGRAGSFHAVTADGSTYVTGTLGNAITGAQSSQTALLQIQPDATWSRYSRIDITSGNSYFAAQAAANGSVAPRLPRDAGQLVVAAISSLTLQATNNFMPASGGRGGMVDITGANLLVRASDQATPAADGGFLVVDADQISNLGVDSVLIGGIRAMGAGGTVIGVTANNLEVETDAAHPLTGPELLLATVADSAANGLTVDGGSVIAAKGTVAAGSDNAITFAAATQSGSLLRVSNGQMVRVTRSGATAAGASLAIGTLPGTRGVSTMAGAVTIDGGVALTLDSSGANKIADSAALTAANYDLSGSVVNLGGGSGGLVLSAANIANFAGATSVSLRSASVFDLYDASGLVIGSAANPIGTLTFDGAGLYSQGGSTTIDAGNIALINSLAVTGTGISGAGGTLTLNASDTITDGVGAKSLGGFSQVNWNAGHEILFTGAGSLDAGPVASASLIFDVGSVAVEQSGAGYTSVPTVTIANGSGGATATASLGVVSVAVASGGGGSGYANGDVVTVTDGSVTATGKAVVNGSGAIIGVTITAKGAGFLATGGSLSVSVNSPGGGSGASLSASLGVVGISVANAGANYTGIPTVKISSADGNGSGAAAQVLGAVTGITLTNSGDSYTGSPSVTISGGGGTGGSASATVAGGVVTGVALGNGGSGYSSIPTVTFSGGGGGAAALVLSAPAILVDGSASQSVQTAGSLAVTQSAGGIPAPAASAINGKLTLTAGSIADSGTIIAQAGQLTLTATTGDLTLSGNALLSATGSLILLGDLTEAIPAGTVKLISDSGNVILGSGTTIDVSSAGTGYAGTLGIEAANGIATLAGTLKGGGAYGDLGGTFVLVANSLPAGNLVLSGFTGSIAVELGQGNLIIGSGQTITSGNVLLVSNDGTITVDGTIDASGPSGGSIALYGSNGVTLGSTARLYARYQADNVKDPAYSSTVSQNGGTITLGTGGTPNGTDNATYGYENVSASGAVTVASGAILDVSGGSGATGGGVYVRAPLLTSNNVNVSFAGTVVTNADSSGNPSGKGVVLNAFVVWSTTDTNTSGGTHFDGIIDPAGFFGNDGAQLIFKDSNGLYPTSTYASPASGANMDHVTFYQSTLLNFVTNPFNGNDAAVAGDFAGATILVSGSGVIPASSSQLHLRPEIDLINPSTAINSGNITVASNWNLGAGTEDSSGNVSLLYRTGSGEPGVVALRAANNVLIKASISDGFYTTYSVADIADAAYGTETASSLYQTYLGYFSNGTLDFNGSGWGVVNGVDYTSIAVSAAYYGIDITKDPDLFGTLEFTLQKPTTITCGGGISNCAKLADQYKQFYIEYVNLFDLYAYYVNQANSFTYATSNADFLTFNSLGGSVDNFEQFPSQPSSSALYYNIKNGITFGGSSDYASAYFSYVASLEDAVQYAYAHSNAQGQQGLYVTSSTYLGTTTGLTVGSAYKSSVAISLLEPVLANTQPQVGVAPPYAPGSDITQMILYSSTVATSSLQPPANQIANNPTTYNGTAVYNTTTAADLMSAAASGKGSFSYDIVAGAKFYTNGSYAVSSVDPDQVLTTTALSSDGLGGDVVISGHSTYTDSLTPHGGGIYPTINIGTVVRTGTGSIDIAAAGTFGLADTTAPGAVYTAGTAIDITTAGDFTAPSLPLAYTANPNGLVNTPAWGTGGGAVTVTAGGDIAGIETASSDGAANWRSWYYHIINKNGSSSGQFAGGHQTAAWVNFATYGDGIGALGGGNVRVTAGGSILDIVVSLPETILVSGGTTSTPAATEHIYGGGNLTVQAGADVSGSAFLVGGGSGSILIGGAAVKDSAGNALQLAVQDGFITVTAGGGIVLGGIYDPASLANTVATTYTPAAALPDGAGSGNTPYLGSNFNSYGASSGVSLTSLSGDVTLVAIQSSMLQPATLAIDAVSGNIVTSGSFTSGVGFELIPSSSGTLTLMAGGSIELLDASGSSTAGTNYSITMADGTHDVGDPLGISAPSALLQAVHTGDSVPVIIYAGKDITGSFNLIKPAEVWAGRDIVNLYFTGMNINATDITSIIAGRDILAELSGGTSTSTLQLYGPGDFLVAAGRNLGPFNVGSGGGILTLGDGSGSSASVISYLPVAGANITALFGVGNGIDYASAIGDYVAASTGGIDFLPSITGQLENTLDTLVTQGKTNASSAAQLESLLAAWGLSTVAPKLTDGGLVPSGYAASVPLNSDQARTIFQKDLSPTEQNVLIDHALVDFLTQVSNDYSNSSSSYYHQYARAYQAINTLFPASLGYTDNNGGGGNGASSTVKTGDLRMGFSLIETQTGGDITILGPGGTAYVGSDVSDKLTQEGILTLQGGSIGVYADGSIELFNSRIFTEQGGNIGLFSANGNIDAGAGLQSSNAYPPYTLICDADGYCRVNPQGLVTGAGIGALVTVAGQDRTKSNVSLTAPHGTVDAGAAGIRAGGNVNIVALHVLNAFNISAGGTVSGVPVAAAPNLGALTAASNTAGSASDAAEAASRNSRQTGPRNSDLPSIITIEVIGYGGGDGGQPAQQDQRRKRDDRQSRYDANDPVRVVGYGQLTADQTGDLTDEEKRKLEGR
jgi:filamentous hemagglutinin family protein